MTKTWAFLSYPRAADAASGHRITELRDLLEREVRTRTGDAGFTVFQDEKAVEWGEPWAARITGAVDEAVFFIPVLSAHFFSSEWCSREANAFLDRVEGREANLYVLPLYFIPFPEYDDARLRREDALMVRMHALQHRPIDRFRSSGWGTPEGRAEVEAIGAEIVGRMGRLKRTRVALRDAEAHLAAGNLGEAQRAFADAGREREAALCEAIAEGAELAGAIARLEAALQEGADAPLAAPAAWATRLAALKERKEREEQAAREEAARREAARAEKRKADAEKRKADAAKRKAEEGAKAAAEEAVKKRADAEKGLEEARAKRPPARSGSGGTQIGLVIVALIGIVAKYWWDHREEPSGIVLSFPEEAPVVEGQGSGNPGLGAPLPRLVYRDVDGDGYGALAGESRLVEVTDPTPDGFVDHAGDCNDLPAANGATQFPGNSDWTCDGVDNDCDGVTDPANGALLHPDRDRDGYYAVSTGGLVSLGSRVPCAELAGCDTQLKLPPAARTLDCMAIPWSRLEGDLDDTDPAIHP